MHGCAEHLRALARQSRLLARRAADRQREALLHDLALLYEGQAADLERALPVAASPFQEA